MVISIKNLRLKFSGVEEKLFDGLNIDVHQGEKVLMLGPSGSGKTTLLQVMSGIIPRSIDIAHKADELVIDDYASVVFQNPDSQFCMPTVGEELAFILENRCIPTEQMESKIEDVLQTVRLDVSLDKSIENLSGGMKQRLAIASSLLQQANTWFLDEPTSMLDPNATNHLWDVIQYIWQDKTVIIVEHKVEQVWNYVDRVILMNYDGEVIASNTPNQILLQFEEQLESFGVWYPGAWNNRPEIIQKAHNPTDTKGILYGHDLIAKRGDKTLWHCDRFEFHSGQWITLEGDNGTGKSTFFEMLMQLIPYDGDIYYDDEQLQSIKMAAQSIYYVYQNPELQFVMNTVFEELYINTYNGQKEQATKQTEDMLKLLKLDHVKTLHPYELSVGQKRRLSVATAILSRADVLLLDEPTFGLDSHNTFELIKLIQQLKNEGKLIITITHDEQILEMYSDVRWIIKDGQLAQRGDHND